MESEKEKEIALNLYRTLRKLQKAYNCSIKCKLLITDKGICLAGSETVREISEDYDDSQGEPVFPFKDKSIVTLESKDRLDYFG